jgi:hypothetical protein
VLAGDVTMGNVLVGLVTPDGRLAEVSGYANSLVIKRYMTGLQIEAYPISVNLPGVSYLATRRISTTFGSDPTISVSFYPGVALISRGHRGLREMGCL